jgi:glycosyltransferase involved in cell wall biosynthesis
MTDVATGRAVRVCLLADSFHPIVGGGEKHARLLSEALARLGVTVIVVTQRRDPQSPAFEAIAGYEVHRVQPRGRARAGKYLMMLPAAATLVEQRKRFDVIYCCGIRTLGIVAVVIGRVLGKPCLLRSESRTEMSGEYALGTYVTGGGRRWRGPAAAAIRWAIWCRNAVLRRADAFLAISSAIREEYLSCQVPAAKIVSIPNGIDLTKYRPASPEAREQLRRRFGVDGRMVFVYAGKLNRGKGLEMLLRVWSRLSDGRHDLHLLLVGAGGGQFLSCEDDLRACVAEHRLGASVTFTGYVGNVDEYLQAADVFVLPSESEAMPLSLIEAMACGLPSIGTTVGGIPDLIEHERTGLLIPVNGEAELEEAMRRLMADRAVAGALGRAAGAATTDRLGIESVAARHREVFAELAAGREANGGW